ncbi:DUF6688 family protein [Lentibacillus sp. CBA3610]|uniref:DUF6688 domain-containing protein n=1 Tax=Lentibacillus sp. CBA3610 TaxID=2518176 RepID=UPI0015951C17|nr:DUF6688 family protein [Lentibacillus sp. CBA3610]QKY71497.1 hypothetical protein Len3610_19860 [Lentibacillus sp. CBA3610]
MLGWLFASLVILLFLSIPAYAFIRTVRSFIGRKKDRNAKAGSVKSKTLDVYYSIFIYCLCLIGLEINKSGLEAGEPLRIFEMTGDKANGYASLANEHMLTVVVFVTLGVVSFWVISLTQSGLSPIIYVGLSTIIILNVLFAAAYLTHTSFSHDGQLFPVFLLQVSFLSLTFLYIARLKDSLDEFLKNQQEKEITYSNKLLLFFFRVTQHYQKMPRLWAITLFPVLIIIQLILVLFGQRPDSFIRVFLETSSFNYSVIPAPKPEIVKGDGHYLCTVSARGHKKLVKPVRSGIRKESRITVNRQLLIANAFENIMEQYIPKSHKIIRTFYDNYGYPISKHINSKWKADAVYFLMKPVELFFLLVLYTVDRKPENRIHMQYSELRTGTRF